MEEKNYFNYYLAAKMLKKLAKEEYISIEESNKWSKAIAQKFGCKPIEIYW